MSRLYNYDTKEWVNVDDAQVDDLVRSGKFVFESGIDVPVVDPYGELKYIKSDDAYNAFNQGFRWQTKDDQRVDFERKSTEIRKEAADDPLLAGLTSAASAATLGGFDVGLRAAEETGILPEGVSQYRADLKTENPISSTLGSVGGGVAATLAAPIAGPLGIVGRGGMEAARLGAGLATTTVGKAALAGAVEGAYWGLGEGVSAAALGKPEDVAANLLIHSTLGGLTGGMFGSAIGGLQAATPALRTAIDKVTDWGNEATKSTARRLAKGISTPVLRLTGKGEDADILRQLIDADPEFGQFVAEGGEEAAKELVKKYRGSLAQLTKESKKLGKEVTDLIDGSVKEEKLLIKQAIVDTKGDVRKAVENIYQQFKDEYAARDAIVDSLAGQPRIFGDRAVKDMEKSLLSIQKYGAEARKGVSEIRTRINSFTGPNASLADEIKMFDEVRGLLREMRGNPDIGKQAHNEVKDLESRISSVLRGQTKRKVNGVPTQIPEEVAAAYRRLDPKYAAYSRLNGIISKESGVNRLFTDPAAMDELAPILSRLGDFGAELTALSKAKDVAARNAALESIALKKAQFVKGGRFKPENMGAVREVLTDLAADPAIKKVGRIEEIQKTLADIEGLTPMNAAIRVNQALGREIPNLDKLTKFEKEFAALERLKGDGSDNPIKTISSLLTRGGIGATIGGVPGAMVGAGSALAASPYKTYKAVLQIQKMSDAGAKALKSAQKKMLDGLSGAKIRKGAAIIAPQTHSRDSIKQKREQFKRIQNAVLNVSTPDKMAQMIEQIGGGVEGAAELKMALALKAQIAVQYLASQQPKDPLAGRLINPLESPWEPSDLDLAEYMRKVEVVNNPILAFERVGNGEITLGEIEALKAVHPEVFSHLQNTVNTAIMEHGNRIPYQRRLMLGTVFQIPTDYSMDPALIAKLQQPYEPQDQGGRGKSGVNLDISPFDTVATETSRQTYGDLT